MDNQTTWTLESAEFPDLLPMRDRSLGTHVSDVITYVCGYEREQPIDNEVLGRMQVGCALEDAIVHRTMAHYGIQPGYELEKDGIFGTFDGESQDTDGNVVIDEIKLTSMYEEPLPLGDSRDITALFGRDPKFAKWQMQLKAYCYMRETNYGRLTSVHVRKDLTAHWRQRLAYFSDVDLLANWNVIIGYAKFMKTHST